MKAMGAEVQLHLSSTPAPDGLTQRKQLEGTKYGCPLMAYCSYEVPRKSVK